MTLTQTLVKPGPAPAETGDLVETDFSPPDSHVRAARSSAIARSQARALLDHNAELQRTVNERTRELRTVVDLLRTQVRERERAEAAMQEMVASLERRLAARTAEVATFFDLTLLAGQAARLADVFAQVLPRIIEVTRSDAVLIHLFDEDGSELRLAGHLNLAGNLAPPIRLAELAEPLRSWLAQPSDPLLTTSFVTLTTLTPALHALDFQTYLGAQIKVGARIAGVLSCCRSTDRGYGIDEVALVAALAEQLGMMLATQRLRQNTRALAVVEERQRLARDMHDTVSQTLYSLALFAQTGREATEDGDAERLAFSLENLQQTTLQALREMNLLLYELRPANLEQEGLHRALEQRLNTVERRTNVQLSVQIDELAGLDPHAETELYYIAVEALNNVLKHAAANNVTLLLTQDGAQVLVRVCDDGSGFEPAQHMGGMGLRNIADRVARLNGRLSITSARGAGTCLDVAIPLEASGRP